MIYSTWQENFTFKILKHLNKFEKGRVRLDVREADKCMKHLIVFNKRVV